MTGFLLMNDDLISRSALYEDCVNQLSKFDVSAFAFKICFPYWIFHKAITEAPHIDAEPVRHGRWILYKQNVECSECHVKWAVDKSIAVVYTSIKDLKYCPNCGAKMDAEVEG